MTLRVDVYNQPHSVLFTGRAGRQPGGKEGLHSTAGHTRPVPLERGSGPGRRARHY